MSSIRYIFVLSLILFAFKLNAQNQIGNTINFGNYNPYVPHGSIIEMTTSSDLYVLNKFSSTLYYYKLESINNQWILTDSITNTAVFAAFGSSTVAVRTNSNEMYVYDRENGSWQQRGSLLSSDASVLIMPTENTICTGKEGEIRVFNWTGTSWNQKGATFFGPINQNWGLHIDMFDDNHIVLGDPLHNSPYPNCGLVQVFEWTGGAWSQKGASINGNANEFLGKSVSFGSANTIAVGATDPGLPAPSSNFCRIYDWNQSWTQRGLDLTFNATTRYGYKVHMPSSNMVAVSDLLYGYDHVPQQFLKGLLTLSKWSGTAWNTIATFEGMNALDGRGESISMPSEDFLAIASGAFIIGWGAGSPAFNVSTYTFCSPKSGVDSINSCGPYQWIDGMTYTEDNNTATFTTQSATGCDSIVELNLKINNVDTGVSVINSTLEAIASNAQFQWFNCDSGVPISGANAAIFAPESNGNYAVIVTQDACSDTSRCFSIMNVGQSDLSKNQLLIFPNPTSKSFSLILDGAFDYEIYDCKGISIKGGKGINQQQIDLQNFPPQIYTIIVYKNGIVSQRKLIVN